MIGSDYLIKIILFQGVIIIVMKKEQGTPVFSPLAGMNVLPQSWVAFLSPFCQEEFTRYRSLFVFTSCLLFAILIDLTPAS
jgi:hypothetical protein